ncbi:MAG: hypothetical protein IT259_17515 [Saprospiraceae bacterium]|nr:hypothetical protein [Saprospiraceae bacterium]
MAESKYPYSFHAFLFPFEWKQQGKETEYRLLEEQTDITLIRAIMSKDARWARASSWASRPSTLIQYNEANYFYDFVRPVLYGDAGDTRFQVYYKHRETDGAHYVITLRDGTEYRLELDDIGLSFYNMGVGILSFHCYNREYANRDDILKINQFGRRLYPPFYGTDTTKTGTQAFFEQDDWAAALGRSEKELARSIRLERNRAPWITEDFAAWERQPELGALPELVRLLLPAGLTQKIKLTPVLDDRMFVVCWAGNDHLSETIRSWDKNDEREWWYKFLFVDGGQKTCQNEEMTRKQLEAHSNVRWLDYGTLYGVSRYSFVCLTGSLEHLLKVNAAFLVSHMQTVYFKLAELALVQRACLLRFSDEVTAIARMDRGDKALIAKAGSLTRQYIRFINKVYFREVTAQEQGIELYDLLLEHMRTDRYVQDLDREIQELHQYINLEEEKRRNEKLDMLTYLGAFFVVPSFVCTYLGINDFDLEKHIGVTALLCLLSASSVFAIIRSAGRWRTFFILAAFALMVYILFFFPHGKFT